MTADVPVGAPAVVMTIVLLAVVAAVAKPFRDTTLDALESTKAVPMK